jgi:excinuclease ABC subunit C
MRRTNGFLTDKMEKMQLIRQLTEQVKLFPEKPGVYIMKNSPGYIIYIGKAKKLRSRVMQITKHTESILII